jgi:putative ABC transport system substrate-binding protein
MTVTIGRRELVVALGSAAAWPLAARAQKAEMPVIGFLSTRSRQDAVDLATAFQRGLYENGFVDGQNLTIDFRWADGHYDRLPALAAELVRRPLKVIAATSVSKVLYEESGRPEHDPANPLHQALTRLGKVLEEEGAAPSAPQADR